MYAIAAMRFQQNKIIRNKDNKQNKMVNFSALWIVCSACCSVILAFFK